MVSRNRVSSQISRESPLAKRLSPLAGRSFVDMLGTRERTEALTYVPITTVGAKECLPSALHTKFLLEHDTDDLYENVFRNLFEFLREEILGEDVGISVKICPRRGKKENERENAKENARENPTVERGEKRERKNSTPERATFIPEI